MDYKIPPKNYGALMIDSRELVLKDEANRAVLAIEKMVHEKPNMAKEVMTYRKYLPIIIRILHQQQELIDGYEKLFERLETDSEDKKGQRWCNQEDELLIELVCNDMSMLEISTTLGRTPASIKTRLTKLVGTKRLSKKVAGRFVGYIDGIQTECSVEGTVFNKN